MNTLENIKKEFHQLQRNNGTSPLTSLENLAFDVFSRMGIPTAKHEEWKYTRISNLFNKEYEFITGKATSSISEVELNDIRLPGYEEANELFFINGIFSPSLSVLRSPELIVLSLDEATQGSYADIISNHLGHSSHYIKDGIHALNTAFVQKGVFIHVPKGQVTEHPVYLYFITDARTVNVFSQPRNLVHIAEAAEVQLVETYATLGSSESFSNQVIEIIVEKGALVGYYKIQNDVSDANQVNTTHFRMIGKSSMHAVTISLNGGIVRNNLTIALEAEHSEAHLYGLYFLKGSSHVDNHTTVDHARPNCQSNELYKGIINDAAGAVFNGKILVQPHAQKTNAYQSNKNILLSETASVYTKPQLEIFADDVKCSHGCTIGRLDEEGLFYLRSRGISEKIARSLLVHAFAVEVLEHIKLIPIRNYVNQLISERLEFNIA